MGVTMRAAIIDMGTNTFNLLIADVDATKHSFHVLHSAKHAVKIGDGGITQGVISNAAIERAMLALSDYAAIIANYECQHVLAFGTSAMRDATNASVLVQRVKLELGIDVAIIDGMEEAQLIVEGVRLALPLGQHPVLIMDIGGGSTEFIIANQEQVFWKESYRLGVSRIRQMLPLSDPMTTANISALDQLLLSELAELPALCLTHGVQTLVGSSGSFDSFFEMITAANGKLQDANSVLSASFDNEELLALHLKLMRLSNAERSVMPGLVQMRVDTIHIASHMVQWTMASCNLSAVMLSTYALKEGVLHRIMSGQKFSKRN